MLNPSTNIVALDGFGRTLLIRLLMRYEMSKNWLMGVDPLVHHSPIRPMITGERRTWPQILFGSLPVSERSAKKGLWPFLGSINHPMEASYRCSMLTIRLPYQGALWFFEKVGWMSASEFWDKLTRRTSPPIILRMRLLILMAVQTRRLSPKTTLCTRIPVCGGKERGRLETPGL